MMLVIWWMLPELSLWTVWPWWQRALQLGLLCASGFAVFVLGLWLSGGAWLTYAIRGRPGRPLTDLG